MILEKYQSYSHQELAAESLKLIQRVAIFLNPARSYDIVRYAGYKRGILPEFKVISNEISFKRSDGLERLFVITKIGEIKTKVHWSRCNDHMIERVMLIHKDLVIDFTNCYYSNNDVIAVSSDESKNQGCGLSLKLGGRLIGLQTLSQVEQKEILETLFKGSTIKLPTHFDNLGVVVTP